MKSKDRLRRYRNSALSVLGVLVIAIIGAAIVAGLMFRKAAAETDNANNAKKAAAQATADADKALSQALTAQMEAGMAQLAAEIAKADANEQKKLADAAAVQAREAQAVAAEQRARAAQQQTIAKVRSLANSSQTLLRQRPQEIQRSMSRAVEAMQLSDSLKMHILEADTALRDNLTSLPHLQKSVKQKPDTVVALSPDGKHFVRALSEEKAGIYAVGSDALLKEIACSPSGVALSSGLKYAVAVVEGGFKIFDLNDDSKSHVLKNDEAGAVDKIAMSPTGRYVVFSILEGEDVGTYSVLKFFETTGGNLIKSFDDLETKINDIAFGPTGNLAAGGKYTVPQRGTFAGTVLLWNLAIEGKTDPDLSPASFPPHDSFLLGDDVNAVAPGNTSFATDLGIFKQVPGATRLKRVCVTPYPSSDDLIPSIKRLAFSDDERTLTLVRGIQAASDSGAKNEESLEVWDTLGQEELVKVFNPKSVLSIGFKPDDRIVVMTGEPTSNEPALVFGTIDGKPEGKLDYGPGPTDGIVKYYSPDNSFMVSINESAAVVWDVWGKKKQTATLGSSLEEIDAAALSKRGDFLVLSAKASDGWLFIVYRSDGSSFKEWKRFKNPYEPVDQMSLSADGGKLAVIHKYANANYVRVWDVVTENEITPESLRPQKGQQSEGFDRGPDMKLIALSPSGRFLVAADQKHQSWIIDLSAGRTAGMGTLLDDTQIESMGFSVDDRYLGLGSNEGILHIFDLKTSEGVAVVATLLHQGIVTNVVFSDDNKYVATASSDRHAYGLAEEESYPIRIWLLQPRDLLKEARARLQSINQ
jgi:WD40 repeat protein